MLNVTESVVILVEFRSAGGFRAWGGGPQEPGEHVFHERRAPVPLSHRPPRPLPPHRGLQGRPTQKVLDQKRKGTSQLRLTVPLSLSPSPSYIGT